MNPSKIIGISIVSATLIFGCSKIDSDEEQQYLARVGSEYLTLSEARKQINDFSLKQDSITALDTYREKWIQRQLILEEANDLELSRQTEIRDRLRRAREEVLINALKDVISAQHNDKTVISDAEALQYYQQNKQQLILDERYVKVRLIENEDLNRVRTAREALQGDSSWIKVAQNYSNRPQQSIELSQKYWPVSSLFNETQTMKQYGASLDSGQISPIQRQEGIYRFVQLTDVHKQGEEAEPRWFIAELKEWLMREKQRKYYNSYLKNLYFNAKENNEIELYNVSTPDFNDNSDSTEIN